MNHIIFLPLLELIDGLLGFYELFIIIAVIISLLINFDILNTYNRGVFVFVNTLNRLTDPVFNQVKRIIPVVAGGLDFSPVIVVFMIHILRNICKYLENYLI